MALLDKRLVQMRSWTRPKVHFRSTWSWTKTFCVKKRFERLVIKFWAKYTEPLHTCDMPHVQKPPTRTRRTSDTRVRSSLILPYILYVTYTFTFTFWCWNICWCTFDPLHFHQNFMTTLLNQTFGQAVALPKNFKDFKNLVPKTLRTFRLRSV